MQTLESGKNKIKEITERLRKDTLEPAEKEAARLVREAEEKAESIVSRAEDESDRLIEEAKAAIEKERSVFETALKQAGKQAVEALKQEIEKELFDKQLGEKVAKASAKPDLVAAILNTLVQAVAKEGSGANLAAAVGKGVKVDEVVEVLLEETRSLLKEGLTIGDFVGGAQLSLKDRQLTLDMSDESVLELLKRYVRKGFCKALFG